MRPSGNGEREIDPLRRDAAAFQRRQVEFEVLVGWLTEDPHEKWDLWVYDSE